MINFSNSLKIVVFLFALVFLAGCKDSGSAKVIYDETINEHDEIIIGHKIHLLKDEPFYLHAHTPYNEKSSILVLKQFDFIFTGISPDAPVDGQITSVFTPGVYTHMLLYVGKDSDGFAYGIEMTVDENPQIKVEFDGHLSTNGQIYIYCLGNNSEEECPKTDFTWGVLHNSDHMWAKSLMPKLYNNLVEHKTELLDIIEDDLNNKYPFQLPIKITIDSTGNYVDIISDGRINGADCTDYIAQVLEESSGVCMDDIYIDAKSLTDYFINDPRGQQIYIDADNNPYASEDTYIYELLSTFTLRDSIPRQTVCSDKRKVSGIALPDKVFKSKSVVDVPEL